MNLYCGAAVVALIWALRLSASSDGVAVVMVAVAALFALFGSSVVVLEVAVFVITVPGAVPAVIFATIVKVEVEPLVKSGLLQLIVPVELTGGLLQLQPGAPLLETKLVLAGIGSLRLAATASDGPALLMATVQVTLPPAIWMAGSPEVVSERSAAGMTVTLAVAAVPGPVSVAAGVVELFFGPVVVPLTFTVKVQEPLGGRITPLSETVPEPAVAVMTPPLPGKQAPLRAVQGVSYDPVRPVKRIASLRSVGKAVPLG